MASLVNVAKSKHVLANVAVCSGLIAFFIIFFATPGAALTENNEKTSGEAELIWSSPEKGLEICDIADAEESSIITVLRIDPEYFEFVLGASGREDSSSKTLSEWAQNLDLVAAINASMYLQDGKTSTGYMRDGAYMNNHKIAERFGAFFVARPLREGLPGALIIDRDEEDWKNKIGDYDLVIQNYRMTNNKGRILWNPGGPLYSISAVAQTRDGKILFLHSHKPVEAYGFARRLSSLPLNISTIMYVEGGAQAGLVIHSENLHRELVKPHAPSFLVTGNINAALPNILGIKRKNKPAGED